MRLILLRHGRTAGDPGRYLGGGHDGPGLDPVGRAQAARAGGRLPGEIWLAAVSPLRRARQTAALALPPPTPTRVDPRLAEIDFGILDGLTWEEVEARHPEVARAWRRELWPRPPGGEAPEAVVARVLAAVIELTGAAPEAGDLLVVTHGGPARIVAGVARGLDPRECWRVRAPHGALRVLTVTAGVRDRWEAARRTAATGARVTVP